MTDKPRVSVVTVTPKMAEQWLGKNIKNRNVSQGKVAAYANDMANGSWDLNGESIKFDADGNMLDGQHRLVACAQTGTPFETLVVKGLPAEVVKTIDTGRKRGFANLMQMRGESYAMQLAAIARRGVMWDRGARSNTGNIQPTHSEMDDWLRQNQSAYAAAEITALFGALRVIPPSINGLCYVLFSRLDVYDAQFFIERANRDAEYFISRGALNDELQRAQPAFNLRRKVLAMRMSPGRVDESSILPFTILAWNSYRAREQRHQFRIPADGWSANYPEPK